MASPVLIEEGELPEALLERETSNDRTHHCSTCSKSFKRREHYQRHVRSHTHEKPFTCRYCGKKYSRKDLVTRHEKTIHSDKRRSSATMPATPGTIELAELFWPGAPATPDVQEGTFDNAIDPSLWDPSVFAQADPLCSPSQSTHKEQLPVNIQSEQTYPTTDPDLAPLDVDDLNQSHQESTSVAPPLSPSVAAEQSSPCLEVNIPSEALTSVLDQVSMSSISGYEPPTLETLRLCISTYFQTFNVHLPLFHIHTFDCSKQPPEVLLMVGAIGALYRLERRTATYLYLAAEARTSNSPLHPDLTYTELFYAGNLVEPNLGPDHDLGLGDARTQLLLSFFALFSGNQEVVENAFDRFGKLINAYQIVQRKLRGKTSRTAQRNTSWTEWVDVESMKRLLHSIWIISNLLAATYGVTPAFTISYHGDVELPCSEELWQASSEEDWRRVRSRPLTLPSLRQAVNILVKTPGTMVTCELPENAYTWSHFAVVVVTHTLAIHIWHGGNSEQGEVSLYGQALQRCGQLIRATGEAQCGDWLETKPSFLFNASGILRICYGRSHPGIPHLDRTALLRGQPDAVSTAMYEYASAPMTRGKTMTETMSGVFDGLCSPDRRSLLLLRKTVALTWSFEHAVASWDTVLIVSRWLHQMEHILQKDWTEDEARLLDHILVVLKAVGCDFADSKSKAAVMMRLWATFCEDTWVWGVVARMGAIYRSLANVYEKTNAS